MADCIKREVENINKFKKAISLGLVSAMAITAFPISTFAASVGSDSMNTLIGEDTAQNAKTQYSEIAIDDAQTEVYLTVEDKDLIASLPTTIIVSGAPTSDGKYIGNYSVGVSGDMSGDKLVTIEPENDNVALKQKGKNDKTATITQEQTEFDSDDFKNKAQTTGAVTADRLTAGSWNGSFNFNINSKKIHYSYYSSIELAANDANNMTTANADITEDNYDNAVAALFINNGKANIKMLKNETNVSDVILSQDVSINLANHTLTFASGKHLTYNKSFYIYNGTLNGVNSASVILGAKTNLNSSLKINNVTVNQEMTKDVKTNSLVVDTSSSNINSNNLTIVQSGVSSESYSATGIVTRNTSSESTFNHYKFYSTVENTKRVRACQVTGTTTFNDPYSEVSTVNGPVQGFLSSTNATSLKINNATINNKSTNGTVLGIYSQGSTCYVDNSEVITNGTNAMTGSIEVDNATLCKISKSNVSSYSSNNYSTSILVNNVADFVISNSIVNSDDNSKQSEGIGSCGLLGQNTSTNSNASFVVNNCTIYGKQWGIETPAYGKSKITGGKYTATNHMAYIGGSADISDAEFFIDKRDKYDSSVLDTAFGFYCGSENCPTDAVVNINNCIINNGTTRAQSGIALTTNYGYTAPKEVNITDTDIYSGWRGIYFDACAGKDHPSVTKVNLYDNTKLYDSKGTLITKDQLTEAISLWKTTEQGSHSSYPCASSTGTKTTPNTYTIIGEGYATAKGNVNAYATDDCNVYDYRSIN